MLNNNQNKHTKCDFSPICTDNNDADIYEL